MFCPENYTLLSEIRTACLDAAKLKHPWPKNYKMPKLPNGHVDWEKDAAFKPYFFSKILFDKVLYHYRSNLLVFSAQTGVLRVSKDLLKFDTSFSMFDSAIPVQDRYRQWNSAYLFMDRAGWTVSLRSWDTLQNKKNKLELYMDDNSVDQRSARVMRKLSGFSVCIPSNILDLQPKTLLTKFDDSLENSKPKVGRPEKITDVRIAYEQEYPNGHKGIPKKTVVDVLEKIVECKFSIDTLNRALKD